MNELRLAGWSSPTSTWVKDGRVAPSTVGGSSEEGWCQWRGVSQCNLSMSHWACPRVWTRICKLFKLFSRAKGNSQFRRKSMPLRWQFSSGSSVAQSCQTLCNPMDCSTPGLPVHHQLTEFTQIHVHGVGDTIQPSHPLSSPSLPAFNLSQHQGLFKRVSSSNQVAKVLELQLQHQSFHWTFRTDFL